MKNRGILLQVFVCMALVLSLVVPASAAASGAVTGSDDRNIVHLAAASSSPAPAVTPNTPEGKIIPMVAAGEHHTVGLKSDGTVVAVGKKYSGQCGVGAWTDITQVAAGEYHTVGLKSDGTVVAVGSNTWGVCDVAGWTDIIQVAVGGGGYGSHTVGLKSDGTVVAAGYNDYGQCEISGWTDIIQLHGRYEHTFALKSDGTVVATGRNLATGWNQWTDIIQVSTGSYHTVGLKSDGTVVAVGTNDYTQLNVGDWTDIVQVAAGGGHTVGLKSDGTVVAAGNNRDGQCGVGEWTNIIQVAAGYWNTVGLESDGTVVAVGSNSYGQCDVGGWNLVLAVPPSECFLTISSLGGLVTTPGEGTFTCDPWTVVDLVAEPDEGYRFNNWSGDVGSIVDVGAALTTIIMDGDHAVRANFLPVDITELSISLSPKSGPSGTDLFVRVTNPQPPKSLEERVVLIFYFNDAIVFSSDYPLDVNSWSTAFWVPDIWPGDYTIKVLHEALNITGTAVFTLLPSHESPDRGIMAGDWIELGYKITGWPADQPYPEWLELEFLSVGKTNYVGVTLHMSDGTEESASVPADLGEGGGEALGLAGFVIPPNLTTGDSVDISGYGDVTIEGETTRTYAGIRRRVVYASFSQSVPFHEIQLTYYWDKETGVMVEASTSSGDMTATAKATETNMWEAGRSATGMPWWPWVIVAVVAVGLGIFFVRRRKRKTA
mgnify:CR=1 FL=1